MKQTKHFKQSAFPLSAKSMVSLLLLLIAMFMPQGAWATDFISEIKVSVENGNSGKNAKSRLTNDGYTLVDADLNGGAGGSTDYVYIGYKTSSNAADAITGLLIVESATGFDAHAFANITNANVIYNGKNYYRCDNYKVNDDGRLDCDLNRHNSKGADIVLYYTKDGNTANGGTPLTSISVVGNTTTTGVVYTRHWKYDTAQNGTSDTDVYGNTNQGNGTAHYITYTTHTHSLTCARVDTNNHKYSCASCGYVSANITHEWQNTGAKISDATCEYATKYYQTCQYCKRTGDDNHTYYSGSDLGHSYDTDGVCTRDASHYQPATLSSGYYQIASYGNLCWFRNEVNSGKAINAKLTADINLSGKSWATSIGEGKEFAGTFDGQGHTITGNARKALFCVLKAGSTVKNVVSSGATSKDNYENAAYQSPFVRRNYGTIENCIVKSAYWDSRNSYLGGITGVNETGGIVRNCGFYDSSLRLRNSANTQVGGIVGVNCASGRIENCFTWGISYMNIGSLGSGGIVCENRAGATVSNCYTNIATPVFKQEGTATNLTSGITAAFITTGEMCYKLNAGTTNGSQVWYQKIGTETFPTPVVKNTANTVYKLVHLKCDGTTPNGSVTYSNSSTPTVEGHGLAEYTPTYTWGGTYADATCSFTLKCNQCNRNVMSQNLAPTKVDANHVDAACGKDGNERWTVAAVSYSNTGDASYTGAAQTKDYVIPGISHNLDLQTGYCQNTGCGADLRVTTSYRVPTYKTPGVASSGIASWQTVSDVKAIPLPSSTTPQTWYSQYYVVQSGQTVSLSKGAICAGNVHLIVEDGATLNINANAQNNAGIAVSGGSTSLTIYGQTENTGKLTSISGKYGACIGGNSNSAGANITINGADVKAGSNEQYTTGLGGGYKNEGYNIIINGGNVTALGRLAAGIGGGYKGEGHDIIINGGNVYAEDKSSGYDGAGIGGGTEKNGYNITINDGHITAIGSGGGAGIGGGYLHTGHNITIAGGIIDARGGSSYADGIGNGRYPSGYYDTKNGYIKFGLKVGIMSGSTVIDNTYGDMFDVVHKKQNITTHIHDLVYNGNATCTTAGTMSAPCDQCNKTIEVEDPEHPSLGHNFDYKTLTASPVEDGLYAYACDNGCGTHTDDHIIKDFNGAGNHLELTKDSEGNYSTSEDITLADANGFVSPVDFTAASVTYNRNIVKDGGKYSFIVPFDIPAAQAAELGTFYQYSKHEEGKVYFDDITKIDNADGIVRANTAYFFEPAKDITSITVENPTFDTTGNMADATNPSEPGLYGTYSQIDIPVGAYDYMEDNGEATFVKVGADNKLNPFRAYLWLGADFSLSKARAFFGDDEPASLITLVKTIEKLKDPDSGVTKEKVKEIVDKLLGKEKPDAGNTEDLDEEDFDW